MKTDSKIFVAGHRGLVGSSLVRQLKDLGYTRIIQKTHQELDLTQQQEVEAFFKEQRFDYVFLAAGRVGGILENSTYPASFIYDNLAIALNVIHASYRHGVQKLLNLGSSCIYPKHTTQPIREEELLSGYLEPTNQAYAIAKIAAIQLCHYYDQQYGTNFLSVMPTNLYGPNDNFDFTSSHVLPALLRKFSLAKMLRQKNFEAIRADLEKFGGIPGKNFASLDDAALAEALKELGLTGEAVILWGSGSPRREFLHADDLARACIFLMSRYNSRDINQFVNVGAGEDMEIRELASLIRQIVGFEGDIRWDITKPDGTPRKLLDSSRIGRLGWSKQIDLKEGIQSVYAEYQRASKKDPEGL